MLFDRILELTLIQKTCQRSIESRVLNISSAIIYAAADQHQSLRNRLSILRGVEIHAATDDGKMVITIESDNDHEAVNTYEAIERLPGVLSMAMIFQQSESNPEQELSPCK